MFDWGAVLPFLLVPLLGFSKGAQHPFTINNLSGFDWGLFIISKQAVEFVHLRGLDTHWKGRVPLLIAPTRGNKEEDRLVNDVYIHIGISQRVTLVLQCKCMIDVFPVLHQVFF